MDHVEGIAFNKICKILQTTAKKIKKYSPETLKGFYEYHFLDLDGIKLTKQEATEILSILDNADNINAIGDKKVEYVRGLLNDEYYISENKLMKKQDLFDFLSFAGLTKEKYKMTIVSTQITPKFIKDMAKSYNWTYKDLADSIGAVETTVRNWMSKGEIPEWAKKSISYIVTIRELERQKGSSNNELDEIKNALRTLLSAINKDDMDEEI